MTEEEIIEFSKERHWDRVRIYCEQYLNEVYGYESLNEFQEKILRKIIETDGNLFILGARQIGVSKLFEAVESYYNSNNINCNYHFRNHKGGILSPINYENKIVLIEGFDKYLNDYSTFYNKRGGMSHLNGVRYIVSSIASDNVKEYYRQSNEGIVSFDDTMRLPYKMNDFEVINHLGYHSHRREYKLLFDDEPDRYMDLLNRIGFYERD